MYKRRGSLFIKNFKRKEIKSRNYLQNLIIYIHLNPVHHGFGLSHIDWKWNSYDSFHILQPKRLEMLFENHENYIAAHQNKLNYTVNFDADLN